MRSLLACALISALVCLEQPAAAAPQRWTITVGAREVMVSVRAGGEMMPAVDAQAMAPLVGITVENRGSAIVLRDSSGGEWHAVDGSTLLTGRTGNRTLSAPITVLGGIVYVPLDAVAELAGLAAVIGPGEHARLVSALLQPTESPAPVGWKAFQITKSAAEREEAQRMNADTGDAPAHNATTRDILPPAREQLMVGLGVGVVSGASGATEMTVAGTSAGWQVNGSAFMTVGEQGALLQAGHVSTTNPSARWTVEGGDLLSDTRGLALGGRIVRHFSGFWNPSLSVYAADARLKQSATTVAYRDEIAISRYFTLRGEWAADNSYFAAVGVNAWRIGFESFLRRAGTGAEDRGALLSYDAWRGVTVRLGVRDGSGPGSSDWSQVGLTVPVGGRSSVALERTLTTMATGSNANTSVSVQTPIGPIRLMQRLQVTDASLFETNRETQQQLQSTASWAPSRRIRLNYQLATQWLPDNTFRQWTELQAVARISASTSLTAVSGFPDLSDTTHLRIGLQTMLRKRLSLEVQYGRLAPFQSATHVDDEPRFMVMVRRTVGLATPARGRKVSGRVLDGMGMAVPSVRVTLDRFSTTSDESGRFVFKRIVPGQYQLAVARESLPAGTAVTTPPLSIRVSDTESTVADLHVTTLGALTGRVYVDANENGQFDAGEGVANVLMRLADTDRATRTDTDGGFGFFNLMPGRHVVAIETARLSPAFQAPQPSAEAEVFSGRTLTDVDLPVVRRDRPLILRELPSR